jgi:hypothetical protein
LSDWPNFNLKIKRKESPKFSWELWWII